MGHRDANRVEFEFGLRSATNSINAPANQHNVQQQKEHHLRKQMLDPRCKQDNRFSVMLIKSSRVRDKFKLTKTAELQTRLPNSQQAAHTCKRQLEYPAGRMTQEECCSIKCLGLGARQRLLASGAHVRCVSSSRRSAIEFRPADCRHKWQVVGARQWQDVNFSKLGQDLASEQTHRQAPNFRRRTVSPDCHSSRVLNPKKPSCKLNENQSRRTKSHRTILVKLGQLEVGESAKRFGFARNDFQKRNPIEPLIENRSASSLASTSPASSSMQSFRDDSCRTEAEISRASVSSLSLVQFNRLNEAGCERKRSLNHSLGTLMIDSSDGERISGAPASSCWKKNREFPLKRSAATHFGENLLSKRPTWRTDLTNSDLSAYASSSDEYENDDVFETASSQRTLNRSRKIESSGLLDEDLKLIDDLSGFGARVSKFSSTEEEPALLRPLGSSLPVGQSHARSHRAARLKLAPEAISSHSLEIGPNEAKHMVDTVAVTASGRSKASSKEDAKSSSGPPQMSMMTRIQRPRFRYWPLLSCSSAFSISTKATNRPVSASEVDAGTRRIKLINAIVDKVDKSGAFNHQRGGIEKARGQLKYFIQQNLVAVLIGVYILISLAIIITLMVPYMSSLLEQHPIRVSAEMQSSESSGISVQRQQETMIRKMSSLEGADTTRTSVPQSSETSMLLENANQSWPSSSLLVDDNSNQKRQLDLIKKRLPLARLVQMRAETKARESESFQELWRVVHKRPCSPLKIPFCSRSLASMLPESATINPDFMASLSADYTMAYDKTLLPNQFTLGRQSQVEQVLESYEPLVDVRCYSLMPLFLCSIFAPKCIQINATAWSQNQHQTDGSSTPARSIASNNKLTTRQLDSPIKRAHKEPPDVKESVDYLDHLFPALRSGSSADERDTNRTIVEKVQLARLVPPCRSVCKEALGKCAFFLEVLSLSLFTAEDCDKLPESSDEKVCVGQRENMLLQRAKANMRCRSEEFRCTNGDCIPRKWHCDGFTDCSDKSDEQHCSKCHSPSQFYCGHEVCIDKSQVCDGHIDCKDGRDERLCLRLANNSTPLITRKPHLRRLEAWNATLAQWAPVCADQWQAVPMSHEACQALGYSRANETLILFGSSPSLIDSADRRLPRSPPVLDHSVSYEQGSLDTQAQPLDVRREHSIEPDMGELRPRLVESLASLLQRGTQFGCELAANSQVTNNQIASTIYLSCQGFQCGRSVTSYLSRVHQQQQQQQLSAIPAKPMLSSVPIANDSEGLPLEPKSLSPSSFRSLMNSFTFNSSVLDDFSSEQEDDDSEANGLEHLAGNRSQLEEGGGGGGDSPAPVSARLVVGGIESMPGEFPYLAALHGGPDEVFFCGGVLIGTHWLLTAAHCVGNRTQPQGWMVKVGVTRRIASPAFVRKLKVRRIIKHYAFNVGAHLNNDIALIQLAEQVEFNQYLRPICLPPAGLKLAADSSKDCVVVGFGKSRFSQEANYLHAAHFAKVPIISQKQCALWYAEHEVRLAEGMLCAGYSEGKRDACQGDSGSGLFCRHSDTNQFFVAGLVSFGIKCATPKLPGVYTSVPHYFDWINRIVGNNGHLLV